MPENITIKIELEIKGQKVSREVLLNEDFKIEIKF
jgi:hypothetical protein